MRARQAAHITSAPKYRSYIGGITEVARHEGVGALFSGLKPTLVGIVPYAGLSFSIFHTLKATARQSLNLKSDNDIPTSIRFACKYKLFTLLLDHRCSVTSAYGFPSIPLNAPFNVLFAVSSVIFPPLPLN